MSRPSLSAKNFNSVQIIVVVEALLRFGIRLGQGLH